MNPLKKLKSMLRHPLRSAVKAWRYVIYKPRFAKYAWSDRVNGAGAITCRCVSLGENVYIGPRCRIQGIERYNHARFSPSIVLADNVSVQQDFYLTCASRVEIGTNTAIAAFVTITDIDHPYVDVDQPIEKQDLVVSGVAIGPDCKIYNGAVITKGTRIGRHCVVGANSVVSGHYPDFCVIAGSPAKIIKRYNRQAGVWQKTDPEGKFI